MGNSSVINKENVIGLVQRTLNEVDKRLVEHGERVAFLVSRMMEAEGGYSREEKQKICMLSLLHDIGAYKTEEIDRMVEFEAEDVWEHPVYGYVFLKSLSPLEKWAEVILFHHIAADKMPEMEDIIRRAAQMINVADRMDILSRGFSGEGAAEKMRKQAFRYLEGKRGTLFSEDAVNSFVKAEIQFGLFEGLIAHQYRTEDIFPEIILSDEACLRYLNMLIYIIDFRSQHTVTHTITTTSISCCVARYMGVTEEQESRICYGAMVHDLGKIGIPVEILEFPGKLSAQAMGIMRTHVDITERILGGAIALDVTNIALRHHEKADGSGYPRGLKQDEMTLEEQIVAVSDIVSALVGTRSYKEAYPKDRTLKIIRSMADEGKLNLKIVEIVENQFDNIINEVAEKCEPALQNYYGIQAEYSLLLTQYRTIS